MRQDPSVYPQINRRQFMAYLKPRLTPDGLENVHTAYLFAKYGHRNQKRDGGVRYFEHPRAVAWILIKELKIIDWRMIVDGLLHDIKEDTFLLSWQRIQKNFGVTVLWDLKFLTKEPKRGYHQRIKEFGSVRVFQVKLADRVNNMRSLEVCSLSKKIKQIRETRKVYIPLADTLITRLSRKDQWRGEYLKAELERLCSLYENKIAQSIIGG